MQRANINDRDSIERVYPRAIFDNEVNANMRAQASVLSGVSILSQPDAAGAFDLARTSRHVGEQADAGGGTVFLCPFASAPGDRDAYEVFVDRIIATARATHIDPTPGPGDARLRGLRQ